MGKTKKSDDQILHEILSLCDKHNVRIRFKDQSLFMKLLGTLLFFNPKFMTTYITTIGHTIYFPNKVKLVMTPGSSADTIAHELVHVMDGERLGILFGASYLFPQILSLGVFGAFFSPWMFLCLLFLAPIPALWRANWEKRGYSMTLAALWWRQGFMASDEWLISQFVGPAYFWMWPFRSMVIMEKNRVENLLKSGQALGLPLEKELRTILTR